MGVEGYSMGNMGLNTDLNSVQMLTQVEQIAQKDSEIMIKDVTKASEGDGVKRKKKESNQNQPEEEGDDNDNEDENQAESDNENLYSLQRGLSEEDIEDSDPKAFIVKLNPRTQFVELLRKEDGKVMEKMPADDLMSIMSKLDNASGILVNRKV